MAVQVCQCILNIMSSYNLTYLLLLFISVTSIYTVLSVNPIHSILSLIVTFVNSAFLLIILGLDFIGLSLIIIYVGAVAILFLFIIMLISFKELDITENIFKYLTFGFLMCYNLYLNFFSNLGFINNSFLSNMEYNDWSLISNKLIIEKIGTYLYTENFINFFLVGIVLLISIFIVIYLANVKTKVKNQDLFNQIQDC